METTIIKRTVIDVDVFYNTNAKTRTYILTFDKPFEGIIKENDVYKIGETNHLSFPDGMLTEVLRKSRKFKAKFNVINDYCQRNNLKLNDELVEHLTEFLLDKTIEIDRSQVKAGDEYADFNGEVHKYQYDTFKKDILSIE